MKGSQYFSLMALAFVAPHIPHVYAVFLAAACVILSIVAAGMDGYSQGDK